MAASEPWCFVRFTDGDGSVVGGCVIDGPGDPDLAAVEVIARLALVARRQGFAVLLSGVRADLRRLLDLSGLPVEMEGQPEGGE